MEPAQPGTSSNSSNDHDPRLDLVKQRYTELSGQIDSINRKLSIGCSSKLCNVFQYIDSTYFYETLAQFGHNTRLSQFYASLKIGDRFVAKVVNVFERSADVLLVWSSKRAIRDLKIKAILRLVESKRYNNGYRQSKYNRQISDVMVNKNLDVSELIYVELVQSNESNRKIEVVRCKSLTDDESVEDNDEDEGLLNEEKFLSKSPNEVSFHNYMMDHNDLRNPSIIKQPTFTSLLHRNEVAQSYRMKQEEIRNKANQASSYQKVEVVLFDENAQSGYDLHRSTSNHVPTRSSRESESVKSKSLTESTQREPKHESRKRTISISSERTANSKSDSSRPLKHSSTSSVSSSSDSSDSDSSSSSSSSRNSYSKRRRKHKKHDRKKHKKLSKKHSKSKKKRSKKSKKRSSSPDKSDRKNSKRKKIDDKILKLLKLT